MAVINELPPDGSDPGDVGNDRQIQPMEHEVQNGADAGDGIGRVSFEFFICTKIPFHQFLFM